MAMLRVRGTDRDVDFTHVDVNVNYDKGGFNVWSGGTDPRGIRVSVWACSVEDGMVQYIIGRGGRYLLHRMDRANAKRLMYWREHVRLQLQSRAGETWDAIVAMCGKIGATPINDDGTWIVPPTGSAEPAKFDTQAIAG